METKEILASHNQDVVRALVHNIPETKLAEIDGPVLAFILNMLEGQCTVESYIAEEMIEETLAMYISDFGCVATPDDATRVAKGVIRSMTEKKLTKKPPEQPARLDAPMSISKQYEDNLKRASMLGVTKICVNTNEEWTWDSKRDAVKTERKRKKDEEKKQILQEQYEEFLRQRGVAGNSRVIKLHQKSEGADYSTDIRCEGIHIRMGKHVLLDNTDLILLTGNKYGLVGKNGSGKTTLLRALTEGELQGVSPFLQILHVEQEIVAGNETALHVVLSADVERMNLIAEEQKLLKEESETSSARLAEVYERMEAIDAHTAEARAAEILHGLSFTTEMMHGPTKALSGGWRMRVALARALFVEPEILLLDEPTNHLDLHAVLWLEQFLKDWKHTLVVVSHSRTFLNSVSTHIVHLDQMKLTYYTGNYDSFEVTRCEQLRLQQRQFDAQEKQRAHVQSFIDRFRYNAKRASMAQSRIKALEKMEVLAPVLVENAFTFSFAEPEEVPSPYLQVIDCEFGYKQGQTLFSDVNFVLDSESRIALVGANGCGKSTFIKMCLGLVEPRKGQVIINRKVRVGHFAQHHLDQLMPQLSALEFMQSKYPNREEQLLRAHLGSLGLSGDKALQPIYTLSGGQKSRLVLAWITFHKPHLLLLDEPTNHLDLDTVSALIQALLSFRGGLLVVSHDEHFITSLCDNMLVCRNNHIDKFDGDFMDYKAQIVKSMKR